MAEAVVDSGELIVGSGEPAAPNNTASRAAAHKARIVWRWAMIEKYYEASRIAVHNYLVDLEKLDLQTERGQFLDMQAEITEGMIDASAMIQRMHAGLLDELLTEQKPKIYVPDERIVMP